MADHIPWRDDPGTEQTGIDARLCAKPDRGGADLSERAFAGPVRVRRQEHRGSGWMVRFQVLGRRSVRYFSDRYYVTAEAARIAAEAFAGYQQDLQHELLALHRRLAPRVTTRSGVPGVARYDRAIGRGPSWIAYLDDPVTGHRRSKRFAVSVHGEWGAHGLALAWRARAVAELQARYDRLREELASGALLRRDQITSL